MGRHQDPAQPEATLQPPAARDPGVEWRRKRGGAGGLGDPPSSYAGLRASRNRTSRLAAGPWKNGENGGNEGQLGEMGGNGVK